VDAEGFEWDDEKRQRNIREHGIDFEEAAEIFYRPYLSHRSDRKQEVRWLAVGESQGRVIAVAFTRRSGRIRIISARRARKNEARKYYSKTMGRSKKGQD
jgi:uncharacterized DUF497 family protein